MVTHEGVGGDSRSERYSSDILKTHRPIKISHHTHTAKHLPIRYTSYAVLFFILSFSLLSIFFVRQQIVGAGPPQTLDGSIQLSGVVPGPPPSDPPVVTGPVSGQRFTTNEAIVIGECEPGLIVEVYRNDIFAGSQMCDGGGQFSITITLVSGENILKVRIRDSIGQYGPDAPLVTVHYDVPTVEDLVTDDELLPRLTVEEASEQIEILQNDPLIALTKPLHSGFYNKQKATLTYTFSGGTAPYAVSINWGDGSENSLETKEVVGEYEATHIYKSAGQYEVIIMITDHTGTRSTIQTIMAISGDKEKIEHIINATCQGGFTLPNCPIGNQVLQYIDQAWPAIAGASVLATSFWLGEQVVYSRALTGKFKLPRKLFK